MRCNFCFKVFFFKKKVFQKNRKALSEITTFVLLTLLIFVSSISAYLFSENVLEEEFNKLDLKNLENFLFKTKFKINSISSYEDSSFRVFLNFNFGKVHFKNNQIYFISQNQYDGKSYCFDFLCYESFNGFEKVFVNLDNGFVFEQDFDLISGEYLLDFVVLKNEKKIRVVFN